MQLTAGKLIWLIIVLTLVCHCYQQAPLVFCIWHFFGEIYSTTTSDAKQYNEEDELGFLGNFNLWLEAPGSGNTGSVDVTADVPVWLQYNWTGVLDNPKGRATFGIYNSGSNKIIHRLERY